MIKIENIKKSFEGREVLKGINIEIKEGEVYGLIGANGAGKTTLMNIISQNLEADSGKVYVDNEEVKSANKIANKIGYIIDIPAAFDFLTAKEYLEFLASPLCLSKDELDKKTKNVLKEVGLVNIENKQIKKFSRGMKQRMGIASALISDPEILLMDEPSSALDPQGRFEVVKIIEHLKEKGKTIILSTHILNDVERICDRMGLLSGGKIVVEGQINDLMNKFSENILIVKTDNGKDYEKVIESCNKTGVLKSYKLQDAAIELYYEKDNKHKLIKAVVNSKVDLDAIYQKTATIEEIFLKTGGKA